LESLPHDKENIRPYDGISHVIAHRKYEEYAYVLDYSQRSKSLTVRGREGLIIQAIGEGRLTLLELLGVQNANFEVGERVYIGREGRNKIVSVLGKLEYASISQSAKNDLSSIVENIVLSNEARFVSYVNSAPPVTPRIHSLELIPGIGKTYMMGIIKEREKKTFESFLDIQTRIGIKDIHKLISRRIVEEITGEVRMNLFVGK
jgi:putative nucleotide binding protein